MRTILRSTVLGVLCLTLLSSCYSVRIESSNLQVPPGSTFAFGGVTIDEHAQVWRPENVDKYKDRWFEALETGFTKALEDRDILGSGNEVTFTFIHLDPGNAALRFFGWGGQGTARFTADCGSCGSATIYGMVRGGWWSAGSMDRMFQKAAKKLARQLEKEARRD